MRGKQLANVTPMTYMCRFLELSLPMNMVYEIYLVPVLVLRIFSL